MRIHKADTKRRIGENIEVSCTHNNKLITNDIWDGNSTDNTLHIKCGHNLKYDAPIHSTPTCVAKCDGNLLVTYPDTKIGKLPIMEDDRRVDVYENDKLW